MHFHTSQTITLSHFPHRQGDDAIGDPQNDPQTVHHPQTKKENKNPSLRIREKRGSSTVSRTAAAKQPAGAQADAQQTF